MSNYKHYSNAMFIRKMDEEIAWVNPPSERLWKKYRFKSVMFKTIEPIYTDPNGYSWRFIEDSVSESPVREQWELLHD